MERYTIDRMIGSGTQARAYLAHRADDAERQIVLKRLPMGAVSNQTMGILMRLVHPAVIRCHEAFTHDDDLFLVLQYADGGDLERLLASAEKRHLSPREVLPWPSVDRLFVQLALGLQYCHDHRTLHRDIKTGNIFVSKDLRNAYLGDFGVAKALTETKLSSTTMVGTPLSLSPEVVSGAGYTFASDVWALGCVLYEMLTLKKPFPYSNIATLISKIVVGEFEALPGTIPAHYRRIIKGMLHIDPLRRYTLQECLGELPRKLVLDIQREWAPATSSSTPVSSPAKPPAVGVAESPSKYLDDAALATGPLNEWIKWKVRECDEIEMYLAMYREDASSLSSSAKPLVQELSPSPAAEDDSPTPARGAGGPTADSAAVGQLNANRARRMLPSPQVIAKQQHPAAVADDPVAVVRMLHMGADAVDPRSPSNEQEAKLQREARRAEQKAELQRLMSQGRHEVAKQPTGRNEVALAPRALEGPRPLDVARQQPTQNRQTDVVTAIDRHNRHDAAMPQPEARQPQVKSNPGSSPPPPQGQPQSAPTASPTRVGGVQAPVRAGLRDMIREQRQHAMANGRQNGDNVSIEIVLPGNLKHLLPQQTDH